MKTSSIYKAFAIVLIIGLIASFTVSSFNAESSPLIEAESVVAEKGEQDVVLPVKIKNNPGIASLAFDVIYNESALSLKGFTYNTEALNGAATVPYNPSAKPACLSMVNGSGNTTGDFTFATLYFDVADTAIGVYDILLVFDKENIYNINEENVDFQVVHGRITINENSQPSAFVSTSVQETDTLSTESDAETTAPAFKLRPKKTNTIKVFVKTKFLKIKRLKKKPQKVKAITVKKAQGKVTYKLVKNGITKKIRKLVKIRPKGVITIKRWKKAKKGTYKVKVKITAKGNTNYNRKTITKTMKLKIK